MKRRCRKMKQKDKVFFDVAAKIAKLSNHPRVKIGCVVVEHGRIISSGANSYTKTHPIQKRLDKLRFDGETTAKVHAEVAALVPLIKNKTDLSKARIYVYREHKDGSLGCSRPCCGCMSLIKECGIKRVLYTNNEGYVCEDLKL